MGSFVVTLFRVFVVLTLPATFLLSPLILQVWKEHNEGTLRQGVLLNPKGPST